MVRHVRASGPLNCAPRAFGVGGQSFRGKPHLPVSAKGESGYAFQPGSPIPCNVSREHLDWYWRDSACGITLATRTVPPLASECPTNAFAFPDPEQNNEIQQLLRRSYPSQIGGRLDPRPSPPVAALELWVSSSMAGSCLLSQSPSPLVVLRGPVADGELRDELAAYGDALSGCPWRRSCSRRRWTAPAAHARSPRRRSAVGSPGTSGLVGVHLRRAVAEVDTPLAVSQ